MPPSSSASTLAPPPPAPSTPASTSARGVVLPGHGDLWSSILDSVKGSATGATAGAGGATGAGGTRGCVVLGAPGSGKSTLISRLRSATGELPPHSSSSSSSAAPKANGAVAREAGAAGERGAEKQLDLGLSYDVLEVRDEGDEGETLARLSVFQLPSPSPPFPSLLSLCLNRQTLLTSLVVLVLDWERPWSWLAELEAWIALLEEQLGGGRRKSGEKDTWEEVEGRERIEQWVRGYQEPQTNGAGGATGAASSSAFAVDLEAPLPQGSLTDNLGVGLVIVCTKADQMNSLEREREFTDEQFDYIQQTLRAIALKYGAALFYTSQTSPSSFSKLRQYLLHRLFSTPSHSAPATSLTAASAAPTSPTSSSFPSVPLSAPVPTGRTSSFPFPHRANVVDRDGVLVPAGWDSWGKIRVLRERFEAEATGEGWEVDLERLREGGASMREGEEGEEGKGLRTEYEAIVVDFEAEEKPVNLAAPTAALDEQSFLKAHYDTLQADAAKDPRLAFRQPASTAGGIGSLAPSVVGPMAGSTLELPTVVSAMERARERAGGEELGRSTRGGQGAGRDQDGFAQPQRMSRQNSQASASARSPPIPSSSAFSSDLRSSTSPSLGASSSSLQRSASQTSSSTGPLSPTLPSSTSSTGARPGAGAAGAAGAAAGGNQVLADFFQSLLTARGAGGAAAGTGAGAAGAPAGGLGQSQGAGGGAV